MGRRGARTLVLLAVMVGCGGDEDEEAKYAESGQGNPPPTDAPFCKGQEVAHALCADFDEGPVESGWTALDLRSGGTFATATEPVRSLPNAAVATASADTRAVAYLLKSLQGGATRAHLVFDVRIDAAGDGNSGATLFNLQTSAGHEVTFNVNSTGEALGCSGAEFLAGAEPSSVVCAAGLTLGTWTRIDVEANYAEGSGNLVIRLGKRREALVDLPLHARLGGTLGLFLGVRTYAGTGTWRVAYDNVLVD